MKYNFQIKSSVIIPIYNTKEFLDECIQSVLNQTQKEVEIILVDDGSTDGSSEIIDEYEYKYRNIIAIHQKNQGLGSARNNGFKVAKGKYVYFMDSDDYIKTDMLEKCYNHAEEKKADFVFFDAHAFWDENGVRKYDTRIRYDRSQKEIGNVIFNGKEYWNKYYKCGGVITCAQFNYISKDYLEKYNLLFETGVYYEDNDWIVRMHVNAARICYYPEKLYYRRYRSGSITQSSYSEMHLKSAVTMFWKLFYLSVNTKDIVSKQMYEDVLHSILNILKEILKTMNLNKFIINFIEELLCKQSELEELSKKTCVKILLFLKNIVDKYEILKRNELIVAKMVIVKRSLNDCIKESYKLDQKINIGIYGIGKMCDEIFHWYEQNRIPIYAQISFIVTENGIDSYRGYPVYNFKKLKNAEFDYIIIASTRYADEMKNNLDLNNIKARECFVTIGCLGES